MRYAIVLRRRRGNRYVKRLDAARSKYQAKLLIEYWQTKYDSGYVITREPWTNPR